MVYRIMPYSYKRKIDEWLRYSGSRINPKRFTNNVFAVCFTLGFVISLFAMEYFIIIWAGVFIFTFLVFHGFLVLGVDRRTSFVERILPDALQLMAANSRAGYIPSRALLLSARDEFGPLSDAIKNVGKEMTTGASFEDGIKVMTRNIKSDSLERTVKLIIEGIRSGGQFASLLEENASDLRMTQAIKKEVKANIMMYVIFVTFAGCVGAPVLYALSSYLVETLGKFGTLAPPEAFTAQVPFMKFSGITVSPEFMSFFFLAAIFITTVFGGLIIGLISSGKERAGIRYIPVFVTIAFVLFFVLRVLVVEMFGIGI